MEINDNVLDGTKWVLLVALFAIIFEDYNWLFAILIISVFLGIKLAQSDRSIEPAINVERTLSGHTFSEGSSIKVTLKLTNNSENVFRGEIVEVLPKIAQIGFGTNLLLLKLKPKETTFVTYSISFSTRGHYEVGPTHLRYHSISETYEKTWTINNFSKVVIIPNPDPVTSYTLPPSFFTSLGGPFKSKLVGDGSDFAGIREYRQSDPFKRINWKQSAKLNVLYSNEFEVNRPTNVIIIIDLAEEASGITDSSVRAALGLIDYLTHWRCKVGLITLSEYIHYIPPKGGRKHILEISEHLTNVKSIDRVKNFQLFAQRLEETFSKIKGSNNEILLFSSLNDFSHILLYLKYIVKLGQVTVLAPTENVLRDHSNQKLLFASKLVQLRRLSLRTKLNKQGIKMYEWVPSSPFDTSLSRW